MCKVRQIFLRSAYGCDVDKVESYYKAVGLCSASKFRQLYSQLYCGGPLMRPTFYVLF